MSDEDFDALVRATTGCNDPLSMVLRGGEVDRYHNEGDVPSQKVGLHTWRVLAIILHIWPDASPELMRATLWHDVEEGLSGDLPAPVKWYNPELKQLLGEMNDRYVYEVMKLPKIHLTDTEIGRMKCADYIELSLYCQSVRTPAALRIYENGMRAVGTFSSRLDLPDLLQLEAFLLQMEPPPGYHSVLNSTIYEVRKNAAKLS